MMNKILTLIILTAVSVVYSHASSGTDEMHQLTASDGLSGNSVGKIVVSNSGKVWSMTSYGIDTFDGKYLYSYGVSVFGKPHNVVIDICEGRHGEIYAATRDGICVLELGQEHFVPIRLDIDEPLCLFPDKDALYIGSREGIFVYERGKARRIPMGNVDVGTGKAVRAIRKSPDGMIYFVSRYGLFCYNPRTGQTTRFDTRATSERGVSFGQFDIKGKYLYLGTKNNGLYKYNTVTSQMERVHGIGNIVTSVYAGEGNELYVATDGTGAWCLDAVNDSITEHYSTEGKGKQHIPINTAYCYLRDKHGVNWFGLSRHGLMYSYRMSRLFKPFDHASQGMAVRSFHIGRDESMIGTYDGVIYIDRRGKTARHFTPGQMGGGHIITSICKYKGIYYIGTYDGSLKMFDPASMSFIPQNIDRSLNSSTVMELKVSPDRLLWIGTNDGLFVTDGQVLLGHFTEHNSRIVGGTVTSISFDSFGNAWLTGGNRQSGGSLTLCQPSFSMQSDNFPKGFFNNEKPLKGCSGHGGKMLFFSDFNVYHTDAGMTDWGALDVPAQVLSSRCCDFIDDSHGHYWMATDKGLLSFDYSFSGVRHFGFSEGLDGHLINKIAADGNGNILVATDKGLFTASAGDLAQYEKDIRFKVKIGKTRIGEHLLSDGKNTIINARRHISLKWGLVSETVSIIPLLGDFSQHSGRIYEYMTDDSGKWTLIKEGEEITIGNLFIGTHSLSLRLAGNNGTVSRYTIDVRPSAFAYVVLVLAILSIVLLVVWIKYRNTTEVLLSEKDEMENALLEMELERQRIESKEVGDSSKYQRVRLDTDECEEKVRAMKRIMMEEKLYLNPELKRSDIAARLGVSPSRLSQIFSIYMNDNYYDFVNRYRMAEFKEIIKSGNYRKYTLTALSEKCGFKKTSFFSAFRKMEGMTPAEYLKRHNISIKY